VGKMLVHYKLAEEARKFILAESLHRYPNETGGILVGGFDGDCVLIEHATGPGPLAQHSSQLFRRDGDYSQRVLDDIVMEYGGRYDYIGEWHSHPVNSGPSAKDVSAMRWIANNKKYAIDQPIIGLCTNESVDTWRLSFYLFDGQQLRELRPYLDFHIFTQINKEKICADLCESMSKILLLLQRIRRFKE
jgi:integrative and conjugative element protein (TIGR02256 family)